MISPSLIFTLTLLLSLPWNISCMLHSIATLVSCVNIIQVTRAISGTWETLYTYLLNVCMLVFFTLLIYIYIFTHLHHVFQGGVVGRLQDGTRDGCFLVFVPSQPSPTFGVANGVEQKRWYVISKVLQQRNWLLPRCLLDHFLWGEPVAMLQSHSS